MNLAIVVGVEKYNSELFDNLPACRNDAMAMSAVLSNVKTLKDTLFIGSETGTEAKRKISDFVEKYKGEDINEFTFYFSGHGERINDDFFYIFTDFERAKKETTGFRNSELDNLVKTLSPKLFIKIVDACFSGTQYIKSESYSPEDYFRKSIAKHGFKDLYFWHSSREYEASYAGSEFSRFTESILTAISDREGDVRYSEIMASVADDLSNKGAPTPIFVTQADHIEKFGTVTPETHALIYKFFGIDKIEESTEESEASTLKVENSIFELVSKKSDEVCFSEQKILEFIADFNREISEWDNDFKKLYTIDIRNNVSTRRLPGAYKIGQWLKESQTQQYFATPTYDEEAYTTEEYKKLPKKPSSRLAFPATAGIWGADDDADYQLETVTKTRRYIAGFKYSHEAENRITETRFLPNKEIIDPISVHTAIIYSNMNLTIHFSYEFLSRNHWNSYSSPECKEWRILKVNANGSAPAAASSQHIIKEVKQWLEDSLVKKIE